MEEGISSVWNLDGEQYYALFQIKTKFVDRILAWDLEGAYWALRTLRMEIDAKLKREETNKFLEQKEREKEKQEKRERKKTEKEVIDELMEAVTIERNVFLEAESEDEARVKFFQILEGAYMHLCHTMKKHKMYYREGEDNRLALLRR